MTAGLETSPGAGLDDIDWPALRELCEAHRTLCEAARGRLLPGQGAAYLEQVEEPARDRLGDIVLADPWSGPAELARLQAGEPPWGALLAAAGAGPDQAEDDDSEQAGDDLGPWDDEYQPAMLSAGELDALSEQIASRILALAGPDGVALAGITARVMSDPSVAALAGAHPASGWGIPPARYHGDAESGPDFPALNYRNEPPEIRAGIASDEVSRPPRSRGVRKLRAQRQARARRRHRQARKYGRRAA